MLDGFEFEYVTKFARLALAVSGGRDSMAMLDTLLQNLGKDRFFVVTVNHNLRGEESKRDRDFVVDFCKDNSLECVVYEEDILSFCAKGGYTLEQGARIRRREIFEQTVSSQKAERVVTAHHMSDNVESVLMHIFRGSGLKGLCGMSLDDGVLLRPMLNCSRESIDGYIKERGLSFVEDSSNESADYTRNRLRREIMPLIKKAYGGVEGNIIRLSERANEIFAYLDRSCRNFTVKDGVAYIPLSVFAEDKAVAAQTIVNAVDSVTTRVDLTDRHIRSVLALKDSKNGASVDLPFGLKAHRQADCVALAVDVKREYCGSVDGYGDYDLGDKVLRVSQERGDGLVCDLDKLRGCEIRNRRVGDTFKRYKGGRKSLGDFLTDIKVPKRLRDGIIVIAKDGEVYLLPEYEIADCVKVDGDTKNKAYISVINKSGQEV